MEQIHASGATITFNDSESTGISGHITDAATGAPIASATAQVMEVTDNLEEMIGITYYTVSPQSIANGSFTTGVLKDKTCRVLFSAYGYIPQLSEPFTLEAATPKEFEISLRPLPMPISGEATVQKDHGFDFMLQRQVSSTSGDLRLLKQDGRLGFLTDAFLHGTLHPAIDVRHYPLCERPIPASGFTKNFVPAVSGKVYMAQARKGMEGVYIAFKVTQVGENDVTLSYCVILPHALKGRVLSSVNGQPQPVYGAVISIEGSSQKAATDTDGRFYITNVLSGTRDVTIAMAPFESQTLSNIEMEARLTQLPSVSLSLPAALAPEEDLCPDDPFKTAPGECGCGVPDGDEDGDGFLYCNDAFPWDASENRDTDGDLIGDNADTDDDNDGMPDTWEASHQGLNPLADDGSGDIDGDGVTNLDEYKAGTNPTDGLDFPATATPLTPANQAQNQSTTLTLEVERNGQRSQRHRATRWQIFGNQEQTRLTLDLTLTEELLRLRVPELTLVPGHTYYWRARFEDGRNVWSPIQAFTTAASTTDTNANGIPDTQEACRTQEERTKLCDPDLDVEIDQIGRARV